MNSGDSIALIAGIIIVIFVAVIANPEYVGGLQFPFKTSVLPEEPITDVQGTPAATPGSDRIPVLPTFSRDANALQYRIIYTDKPYSYPLYMIPGNMETFGASEILPKTVEWVPFAYIEETRGGLTGVFSVPYPVWAINSTVIADRHPQYSIFRMALCDADSGRVIEGEEILNRGTSYRIVQTSGTGMYLIISAENVDRFYLRLETPRNYYDAYHSP